MINEELEVLGVAQDELDQTIVAAADGEDENTDETSGEEEVDELEELDDEEAGEESDEEAAEESDESTEG